MRTIIIQYVNFFRFMTTILVRYDFKFKDEIVVHVQNENYHL